MPTPRLNVNNYNRDVAMRKVQKEAQNGSVKIYCDLNRICELEDAVFEWYEPEYYQRKSEITDISFLNTCFNLKQVHYAGVDGVICKALVKAHKEGVIPQKHLGLDIQVKGKHAELMNEIKRIGYLKDREVPLQVRLGDSLIVYISQTSA